MSRRYDAPPGLDPEMHETLARRVMMIWGYQWVEFADCVAAERGSKKRAELDEAYSLRCDAQDAVTGIMRQLAPQPTEAEVKRRAKIADAMAASKATSLQDSEV